MRLTRAAATRLFGTAVAVAATVVFAQPAGAHTDFDYSVPTDGASVGDPASEVTVAFTLPVTLIGNGFEVFDPQENVLLPFAVTDDNTVFRLQFDPPLAGGPVGVKYTVTAEDGHVLSGSFVFTVSVDLPPPTTAAPTLPPATEPVSVPVTSAPADTVPEIVAAAEVPTTVLPAAETASDAVIAPPESTALAPSDGSGAADGSSNSGLLIGIAMGVAALALVFLAFRARTSTDRGITPP